VTCDAAVQVSDDDGAGVDVISSAQKVTHWLPKTELTRILDAAVSG